MRRRDFGWWNEGRDSEECQAATVAVYRSIWHAIQLNWLELLAAACGLTGAWLLANNGQHAAWGWWAFLASNVGWIAFGWLRHHWFLVLQQAGFAASSLWGIWSWR